VVEKRLRTTALETTFGSNAVTAASNNVDILGGKNVKSRQRIQRRKSQALFHMGEDHVLKTNLCVKLKKHISSQIPPELK